MWNEEISVAEMLSALADNIEDGKNDEESWDAFHRLVQKLALDYESAQSADQLIPAELRLDDRDDASNKEIFYYWFTDDSVLRYEHSKKHTKVLALKYCEKDE